MKPLAIITGVGPGTGAALVRRYAEGGYRVAMLARDVGRLDTLAREVPDSFALPCDVGDPDALLAALDQAAAAGGSSATGSRPISPATASAGTTRPSSRSTTPWVIGISTPRLAARCSTVRAQ